MFACMVLYIYVCTHALIYIYISTPAHTQRFAVFLTLYLSLSHKPQVLEKAYCKKEHIYTRALPHTHTLSLTHTHKHTSAKGNTLRNARVNQNIHSLSYTRAHARACACARALSLSLSLPHTDASSNTLQNA